MKIKLLEILIVMTGLVLSETRYVLNTKRVSSTEIGITCTNGGDPAGEKIGDTLYISCGK